MNRPAAHKKDNDLLKALKQRIREEQALNTDSVDNPTITDLFQPLFNSDSLTLSDIDFGQVQDDYFQLEATTTLYSKEVRVNVNFQLEDKDLSLTINSMGSDMSFTLRKMVKLGLLPARPFTPKNWPNVEVEGISFVFDSNNKTLVFKTNGGEKWSFLGYTNLFIDNPQISITNTASGPYRTQQIGVQGALKSNNGKVDILIAVRLPQGILGWQVSLAAPVKLSTAPAILSALIDTDVTGLLPEQFSTVLDNISLNSFYVQFNTSDSEGLIQNVGFQLEINSDWVIIENVLKFDKGITLTLEGQRFSKDLSYQGSITGSATVNYSNPDKKITAHASIPIPLSGGDWQISMGSPEDPVGLDRLVYLAPSVDTWMPMGIVEQLSQVLIQRLEISFRYKKGFQLTRFAFDIRSDNKWTLPRLQSQVFLDQLRFSLNVTLPVSASTVSGSLSGNINIANGAVQLPVIISKNQASPNWMLNVTSDQIPLPDIGSLGDFMGRGPLVSGAPPGLLRLGQFNLTNLNLDWNLGGNWLLRQLSFNIVSSANTTAWNLVPGYFTLDQFSLGLNIQNQTNGQRDISGNVFGMVSLSLSGSDALQLSMSAVKASSSDPWMFSGSLAEKNKYHLHTILSALRLPAPVVVLLPNPFVKRLNLSIEPTSGSFSANLVLKPDGQWEIMNTANIQIALKQLSFNLERYDGNVNFKGQGNFHLVKPSKKAPALVTLQVTYHQSIWQFNGDYEGGLCINDLLKKYIRGINSDTIPQLTIDKVAVQLVKGEEEKKGKKTDYNTLDFLISGTLSLTIVQQLTIRAAVHLLYDSRKEEAQRYNGTQLSGDLEFGGLSFGITATYANQSFSEYAYNLNLGGITIEGRMSSSGNLTTFTFKFGKESETSFSLGDLISRLIAAATNGQPADIPSPWNFINNIPLDSFSLIFTYNKKNKKKTVGLTYQLNLNFGFINLEEISLIYKPEEEGNAGPVDFAVTKGSFLGQPIDENGAVLLNDGRGETKKVGWDLRNPQDAPAVPGLGDQVFDLKNLSLGNQVQIVDAKPPRSVNAAITQLEQAFDQGNDSNALPSTLSFNQDYGWLIGARFVLIEYINVAVIFYDPVIYGLAIDVEGGKFKGLNFEILYKKVNDETGVFEIELTLPDYIRRQQFGAVAVTIPSIALSIYTNGDFLIDIGFPHNADFSRSFGLEFSIFTGAGGLYFGKLSNDTATDFNLPETTQGQFNPVIAFGIGIKAGVGRSANKGILRAELSLTIQVILEGVYAKYLPNSGNGGEAEYFRLQAQASLVGRIYGEVNFAIISASVDITAKIMAQVMLEVYKQTLVTFTAAVSASIQIRVNLGLFSITVSSSFSTSISDSFTIGANSQAPWETSTPEPRGIENLEQGHVSLYDPVWYTALDQNTTTQSPVSMNWEAAIDYPKSKVDLLFLPQLSASYDATNTEKRQAVGVSMLYVHNKPDSGKETDFVKLSRALLAWTLNAYFAANQSKDVLADVPILQREVCIHDLKEIYDYFDRAAFANGTDQPFDLSILMDYFFGQCFKKVTVKVPQPQKKGEKDQNMNVAVFPMIPILEMIALSGVKIDFQEFGKLSAADLKTIKAYFRSMQVQFKDREEEEAAFDRAELPALTLAEYLFTDYFAMIIKNGIQDAINDFKEIRVSPENGKSLSDVFQANYSGEQDWPAFTKANRHLLLKENASVKIPACTYRLKDGETLDSFLESYPELKQASLNNQMGVGYSAGDLVELPHFELTIPEGQTSKTSMWSLEEKYDLDHGELWRANANVKGLIAEGEEIVCPQVSKRNVEDILDYLQDGPKKSLANIGGTVTRFFLHGLRIPNVFQGTAVSSERIGIFEASGQQFLLTGLKEGDKVSLQVNNQNTQPAWLDLGETGQIAFEFNPEIVAGAAAIGNSSFVPSLNMLDQAQVKRYRIHNKTFSLRQGVQWQNPNTGNGKSESFKDMYIWEFPQKLQSFLEANPGQPMQLFSQGRQSLHSLENLRSVVPTYLATLVELKIRRVPSSGNSTEFLKTVYEVIGCSSADSALLYQIISNPRIADILFLDILFNVNSSQGNGSEKSIGFTSCARSQYQTFLAQSNFSTQSNSGNRFITTDSNDPLSNQRRSNLLGIEAVEFLTMLWQCSVVRSGGYYLYYGQNSGEKGLPDHLFNQEGIASISVLSTFRIGASKGSYALPAYINTVVLNTKTGLTQDNLYFEVSMAEESLSSFDPNLQTITSTILPGTGLFEGGRRNPAELEMVAKACENVDCQLSELFNLLEFKIAESGEYKSSPFALPAGPLVSTGENLNSISMALPQAKIADGWTYDGVVPIYRFLAKKHKELVASGQALNPYLAIGKEASIVFNFLDVFGNNLLSPDENQITQAITPLYTDPIISLDQWANVSKSYRVLIDTKTKKPVLRITLGFQSEESNPLKNVAEARLFYTTVLQQLEQPDVRAHVSTSLVVVSNAHQPLVLEYLVGFVKEILVFLHPDSDSLGEREEKKGPVCIIDLNIETEHLNPAYIFCLIVFFSIKRTRFIDPQFEKEPGVSSASSLIHPDFGSGAKSKGKGNKGAEINIFANELEAALPRIKVGTSPRQGAGNQQPGNTEIWLIRYAAEIPKGKNISFSFGKTPSYLALAPLSTSLISRPSSDNPNQFVPIRTYTRGEYIGDVNPEMKAFSEINMQELMRTFLFGLERFFSAELITRAWAIQQNNGSTAVDLTDPRNDPYGAITASKKKIAQAIVKKQLLAIWQDVNPHDVSKARSDLKQILLTDLTKVYSITALVQNLVKIENQDSMPKATVLGEFAVAGTNNKSNARHFSSSRFSLGQTSKGNSSKTTTSTFFNLRPESNAGNGDTDLIDMFEANLKFNFTELEHDFGAPFNDYTPSKWIRLVKREVVPPVVKAKIPILLKAYPTAPAMIRQGEAPATQPNPTEKRLEKLLEWTYAFTYSYVAELQDTIYLNIALNTQREGLVQNGTVDPLATERDRRGALPGDLFEALLQFNGSHDAILSDLISDDEQVALVALQSFSWITQLVADLWGSWELTELEQAAGNVEETAVTDVIQEGQLNFEIGEFSGKGKLKNALLIGVKSLNGKDKGNGIHCVKLGELMGIVVKGSAYKGWDQVFYFKTPGNEIVKYANRRLFRERSIEVSGLNILNHQNAWAGISVHRNEKFGKNKTSSLFVYQTPYIRFVQPYLPSIRNSTEINLADYDSKLKGRKHKLSVYLNSFLNALFKNAPSSTITIQMQSGFWYPLQNSPSQNLSLGPVIPIVLTTPQTILISREHNKRGEKNDASSLSAFVNNLSASINDWFYENDVQAGSGGKLYFSLILFSNTDNNANHELLKLDGLYLNQNEIRLEPNS